MNETPEDKDQEKFNDTLKRMLKTPPKPKVHASSIDKSRSSATQTVSNDEEKPSRNG
jgi:hypothetical protein